MKIVSAKCPNCGGILEVDSEKDAAICQFCQTPFIVEKAIENYNITNNYTTVNNTYNKTINNISGQEVHVHQDGESAEQLFENIKALLNRKEYNLAEKSYQKFKEKYPADYRVDEIQLLFILAGEAFDYNKRHYKWIPEYAGYENICGYALNIFIQVLDRLKNTVYEIYEAYRKQLLEAKNKKLSQESGKTIQGEMLYCKLRINSFFALTGGGKSYDTYDIIKVFNLFNEEPRYAAYEDRNDYHPFHQLDNMISNLKFYTDILLSKSIDFDGVVLTDKDSDDDYLLYLAASSEKYATRIRKWDVINSLKGAALLNQIKERKEKSERLMLKFRDAALSRLSPEGKKKYNEEQERIKKEQRSNVIKNFWNNYVRLLRANSMKDAYNLLLSNPSMKGVKEELANFKKGLLGVKYLGDISAFNVNEVIASSLKSEGL